MLDHIRCNENLLSLNELLLHVLPDVLSEEMAFHNLCIGNSLSSNEKTFFHLLLTNVSSNLCSLEKIYLLGVILLGFDNDLNLILDLKSLC